MSRKHKPPAVEIPWDVADPSAAGLEEDGGAPYPVEDEWDYGAPPAEAAPAEAMPALVAFDAPAFFLSLIHI